MRVAEARLPAAPFPRVVGIGELAVSAMVDDVLVTYALGSCLGVVLYDPVARVGGLLHAMLPDSRLDPQRALVTPGRFVDTGVPELFHACYAAGAKRERLVVAVAGGAALRDGAADSFRIGAKNLAMLRRILDRNGIPLYAEDVGGTTARTLSLVVATGEISVRGNGTTTRLRAARSGA